MSSNTSNKQKLVLCIGWTCVDIVTIVDKFPKEDTDSSINDYYWQRGGNASNMATVLALLGESCELLTVVAKNCQEYGFLMEDIKKKNINIDNCVLSDTKQCPLATIILSKQNGSRTILYTHKDLPELQENNFNCILENSEKYSWIHFEGRPNIECICKILAKIDKLSTRSDLITSVELEHPNIPNIEMLLDKADYVFVSKDYAQHNGFQDKISTVKNLSLKIRKGSTIVCAWGEDGAVAKKHDEIFSVPAMKLDKIVDTLGAGDTFIAAFIHSKLKGQGLEESLANSCAVAGKKCTEYGYSALKNFSTQK